MTGPDIIKNIIKIMSEDFFNFKIRKIIKGDILYNEIFNNFDMYGNTPIVDLDSEHIWINKNNDVGISIPIVDADYNIKNKIITYEDFEYIYGVKYFCNKTKSIGYTFQYKSWVIKPFLIIEHEWEPVLQNEFHIFKNKSFIYKCKQCGCEGLRKFQDKYIINNEILTCDQIIIKNIIK